MIPTYNEAPAIGECLERALGQTVVDLEVLVADGRSSDGTRDIVAAIAAADERLRLLDNPRRTQSAGLNTALAASDGAVIVRLDARSFVAPDYVARCVELLNATGAAVVGGRMVARSSGTSVADGIALANGSAWGAGPAAFHRAGEPGPAETVYLGAFRRAWLEEVGGWAEDVGVNEDYELNHRIRTAGGVVWLDPSLEVGYQARGNLRALAKQYFRYGRSKATVIRRHPSSVRVRQLLPALLAPTAAVSSVSGGGPARAARAALALHVLAVAVAASTSSGRPRVRATGAVAAWLMHWSWSVGFWFGALRPFRAAAAA